MEKTIYNNWDGYSWEDAKAFCIERHLDDEPNDTNWTPSDEEVQEEIDFNYQTSWEDTEYDLKNFFDNGDTFILTGYAGLWNGNAAGGDIINNYNELTKAWSRCDYVKITDTNGVFKIEAMHHDGTNNWTIRKLTKKGLAYLEKHAYDDPRTLHTKLFGKGYSVNLHYAKKVWG